MRKVRSSRPAGEKGKKKKIMRKEPGKYEGERERRMELGGRRGSARQREMKSSFIQTVSDNYQCIYSIP